MLPQRLREMRKAKKLTQEELAKLVNTKKTTISNYETGYSTPSNEMLLDLANILDTSTDYLLGRPENPQTGFDPLTIKEERDIAKDIEKMINDLESNESLAFQGEAMDEESKDLLRISLENSMRLAKQMAKKKFTPNKYKK